MLGRVFRGVTVGLFAALGAYVIGADGTTILALLVVAIVVAAVDILAGEIFTLMVLFGVGALLWAFTPAGPALTNEIAKYRQGAGPANPETSVPK